MDKLIDLLMLIVGSKNENKDSGIVSFSRRYPVPIPLQKVTARVYVPFTFHLTASTIDTAAAATHLPPLDVERLIVYHSRPYLKHLVIQLTHGILREDPQRTPSIALLSSSFFGWLDLFLLCLGHHASAGEAVFVLLSFRINQKESLSTMSVLQDG